MARARKTDETVVEEPKLQFVPTVDEFITPEYKTEGAACFDIPLQSDTSFGGLRNTTWAIPLGFKVNIPKGYSMRLHLRSSIGRDCNIMLSNGVGIIDEDFKGEVKAYVRTLDATPFMFDRGARLFQAELIKTEKLEMEVLPKDIELEPTERGEESGSTGL